MPISEEGKVELKKEAREFVVISQEGLKGKVEEGHEKLRSQLYQNPPLNIS